MDEKFVFNDKNDLVKYLYARLINPTQIKVQKTLYLLFAFYGATYGQLRNNSDEKTDFDDQVYPEFLFNANFEAWRYGPVECDVYKNEKNDEYSNIEECYQVEQSDDMQMKNILDFVDSIIEQTNEIDDFTLVDRTHQDNSWLDVYEEGKAHIQMDNSSIIKEYVESYV